ncbi:MAG: hypothetical protein JWL83_1658 [Actinomycetia bacterium]|nr:hypothetical protein [Actinomycetes bacterium]
MPHCAIYKSLTAEFLDDFYSGEGTPIDDAYTIAEQLLQAHQHQSLSATTAELNSTNRLATDVGNPQDFENFWLSDKSQLAGKEVDRVLRHGYAEAIRIGRQEYPAPVPIETFWITGAGPDFELHICKGKHRITVFMLIPNARRYGSTRSEATSFIVRAGGLRDDDAMPLHDGPPPIVKIQVSGRKTPQS